MIARFGWGAKRYCRAHVARAMSAALGEAANLYRVGLGDTRSVTAGRARGAGRSLPALAPKLLTLSTLLFALTLVGCARHSERQTRAAPV